MHEVFSVLLGTRTINDDDLSSRSLEVEVAFR